MPTDKPYDSVGAIMEFEQGTLSREDTIKLFQHLIDTGLAWKLQGSYGRAAQNLIDQGICRPAKKGVNRADRD